MKNVFVATFIEYSDTCDGHPRVLGIYATESDARKHVNNDIDEARSHWSKSVNVFVDYNKMELTHEDGDVICCWSISGHTMPN